MKTCVSSYSFGAYRKNDSLGYLGIIDKAAEMGFDAIEFTEGDWQDLPNGKGAKNIKERCAKNNLKAAAFCVGADFLKNGEDEIKRVCALVDTAADMGAKMLRHDISGGLKDKKYGIGYDGFVEYFAKCALEITKYAEQKGVKTMTENHGFFSQDALRVEKLINAVAHPNFGALVDTGNFLCADEDPAVSVALLAPYAFHVHVKDFFVKPGTQPAPGEGWFFSRAGNHLRGTVIGHGDAKAYQSVKTLKRGGYDGYYSIEFEGMEDNLRGIALGLKYLKACCGE